MRACRTAGLLFLSGACLQLFAGIAGAQQSGMLGYWKEPGGSIVQVATCGKDICVNIVSISPTAPGRVITTTQMPAFVGDRSAVCALEKALSRCHRPRRKKESSTIQSPAERIAAGWKVMATN